ncbi:MAG: S41 family peptidase [Pyrinomonadaceae bacterium]
MKYLSRFALSIAILFVFGSFERIAAQRAKVPPRRPPRPVELFTTAQPDATKTLSPVVQRRMDAFQKVWTTINDNYFDKTFNDLDWQKIRAEFALKVEKAASDGEMYLLLNQMIGRLQKSHLVVISPDVYQAIERAKVEAKTREAERAATEHDTAENTTAPDLDDPLTEYGIGADLRIIDDRFVITRLDRDSAAEYSGLKTGYIIDKINGVSLAELLRRVDLQGSNAAKVRKYLPFEIVNSFLNGEKDSYVTITYSDAADTPKEATIRREKLRSETITLGRNFPDRQLKFEAESLSDEVGYVRFNLFAMPVIGKFCDALSTLKDKKALVIDLRGNLGGVLASMVALGGMLTDKPLDLGTSIYRSGSERLTAESKKKNFKGKIAILTDFQTVSASEVFAESLQDAGRAVVVGDTTAGEALPSVAVELPTGGVLLYPIANYRSSSGKYLEGNGVTPDVRVSRTRKALLAGIDEQLKAAVDTLRDPGFAIHPKTAPPANYYGTTGRESTPTLPPPPPPSPKPAATRTAGGTSGTTASGTSFTAAATDIKDSQSRKILDEFVEKIGGKAALSQLNSYSLTGHAEIFLKGATNQFDIGIFYEKPAKYSEIMRSKAAGEVREVHNGPTNFVQTEYGLTRDLPGFANTGDLDMFAPIRSAADLGFYKSLRFVGVFDRDGRKVNLIDGRTKDGYYLALAFDVETKLLVSFTGSYYGLGFSDYRKAGSLLLPYRIERERVMNITLDEVRVNDPIPPDNFSKKENCFDKEL